MQAMHTLTDLFNQAVRYHHNGQLALAETICRQILEADSRHGHAWHLLGIIAGQLGRSDVAVEHMEQALRFIPDFAPAHNNLGNVYRDQQGNLAKAEVCFREAIRLKSDYAVAHNNLGNVLYDRRQLKEAEACYRTALRLNPGIAEAYHGLGNVLRDQGPLDEAAACYREALRLQPGYADAHGELGVVLGSQGKLEEAEDCCRTALRLKPNCAELLGNLGVVLQKQYRLADAEACYREALRLKPDYATANCNLGFALQEQGRLADAEACYREALRLKPDYAEAHFHLGFLLLLRGDLARGWPEYEWRWQTRDNLAGLTPPTWDGGVLDGRTILLQVEQGFGDTFQFIRYARLVKNKGGRVLLQCPSTVTAVMAGCVDIDLLVPEGTPVPDHDVRSPLMSLPLLFGTTLETIPAEVPYLAADIDRAGHWRARLAELPGFKVGICWQGRTQHKRDPLRSVPLAWFRPLAAMPDVCLIVLQRGAGLEQLAHEGEHPRIVNLPAEGWFETAALIHGLDLVISVDTAVAHLAGALGVPTWLALSTIPDWRWLLNREDSPWYPTMRLFRQRQFGDWADVFRRLAVEMRSLLDARASKERG
jgi:tetratricopeptide (TPR) repeat protein